MPLRVATQVCRSNYIEGRLRKLEKVYGKGMCKKGGEEDRGEGESERGDNELGLRNDRRNTDDSQPRHGLITGVDITKGYADHEFVIGSL